MEMYATVGFCMQAFAVIVASPLRVDLSCILEHVVAELTAFLQKVCYSSHYNTFINLTYDVFFLSKLNVFDLILKSNFMN